MNSHNSYHLHTYWVRENHILAKGVEKLVSTSKINGKTPSLLNPAALILLLTLSASVDQVLKFFDHPGLFPTPLFPGLFPGNPFDFFGGTPENGLEQGGSDLTGGDNTVNDMSTKRFKQGIFDLVMVLVVVGLVVFSVAGGGDGGDSLEGCNGSEE